MTHVSPLRRTIACLAASLTLCYATVAADEPYGRHQFSQSDSEHWAFVPIRRPAVPAVKDAGWVKTPIDAFILARLEEEGVAPNPPAERGVLLRRVYLDLIGLLPTPAEQDAFLPIRRLRRSPK